MNRHERRAKSKKQRFVAKCQLCEAESCVVHVITRLGQDDLGICRGCPCAPGTCDSCSESGQHWLGCRAVGIPRDAAGELLH